MQTLALNPNPNPSLKPNPNPNPNPNLPRHHGAMMVFSQEDYSPDAAQPLPAGEEMLASSCTVGECEEGCTQCEWEKCTVLKHDGNEKYTVRIHADQATVAGLPRRFLQVAMPTENKVSYCMETKVFTVTLCVAHVDTTCGLKDGTQPRKPDRPGRHYDPVTREYVDREGGGGHLDIGPPL